MIKIDRRYDSEPLKWLFIRWNVLLLQLSKRFPYKDSVVLSWRALQLSESCGLALSFRKKAFVFSILEDST